MTDLREQGLKSIEPYIRAIKDSTIRKFTRSCLEEAPPYFWHIPASSSGKWHPVWAVMESGLLRHTVLAIYLGKELARTFGLTPLETDIALSALAIHDTVKYGMGVYDVQYYPMHPYLPRICYKKLAQEHFTNPVIPNTIFDAVERHMGSINDGEWTSIGRIKPENRVEYVVHLADYIASRKKIHFEDFLE